MKIFFKLSGAFWGNLRIFVDKSSIFVYDNLRDFSREVMTMAEQYSVLLSELIREFSLNILFMPEHDVRVISRAVNRPGLPLAGFFDHFEPERVQIIGKVEYLYLQSIDSEMRIKRLSDFFEKRPVAVVYTAGLVASEDALQFAKDADVPLLSTPTTPRFPKSAIPHTSIAVLALQSTPVQEVRVTQTMHPPRLWLK